MKKKGQWKEKNLPIQKEFEIGKQWTLLLQCNERDGVIQSSLMEILSTPLVGMMERRNWQVLKDTISTPTVGNQLPLSNSADTIMLLFVVEIPSSALVENQMNH